MVLQSKLFTADLGQTRETLPSYNCTYPVYQWLDVLNLNSGLISAINTRMIAYAMLGKTFLQAQSPCPGAQIISNQDLVSGLQRDRCQIVPVGHLHGRNWLDFLLQWFSVFWWKKSLTLAGWNCMGLQVWRWLPHVSTVERSGMFACLILLETDWFTFRLEMPSDTFRKTVDGEAQSTLPERGGWSTSHWGNVTHSSFNSLFSFNMLVRSVFSTINQKTWGMREKCNDYHMGSTILYRLVSYLLVERFPSKGLDTWLRLWQQFAESYWT